LVVTKESITNKLYSSIWQWKLTGKSTDKKASHFNYTSQYVIYGASRSL